MSNELQRDDEFKCVIAGGRKFGDYKLLKAICDDVLQSYTKLFDKIEIVSGGAIGTDKLGERYASEMGYPIKRFPPNYSQHGRYAPIKRNEEMAQYCDACIIFWDGHSNGTFSMMQFAKRYNKTILWTHLFSTPLKHQSSHPNN